MRKNWFECDSHKVVYKITYPNSKIYVGQDITDDVLYFGSGNYKNISSDLNMLTREQRNVFVIKREILFESKTVSKKELDEKEKEFILKLRSNDPKIGYNLRPKFKNI